MKPLTPKQIELLIAALNFANLSKKVFMDHLSWQGHQDVAAYADQQIERLRRKLSRNR